jgi:hypothetical protein
MPSERLVILSSSTLERDISTSKTSILSHSFFNKQIFEFSTVDCSDLLPLFCILFQGIRGKQWTTNIQQSFKGYHFLFPSIILCSARLYHQTRGAFFRTWRDVSSRLGSMHLVLAILYHGSPSNVIFQR